MKTLEERAAEYELDPTDADELKGLVVLPHEFRVELLRRYTSPRGRDALINLFSRFIGMALAVEANTRTQVDDFLAFKGAIETGDAGKQLNLPTLFGAACGATLASKADQRKTCATCAYRLGSVANQSPATTSDALSAECFGDDFMCHENLDENAEPTKLCAGYAQARKGAN